MRPSTTAITTIAVLTLGLGVCLSTTPALAGDESPGQEAFEASKCNMCHSVDSLGIERTSTSDKMKAEDLSTVGDDLELDWAVKFIKKEVELDGEMHKKTFKGTDEEAQQIAEWLMTLKSAG